MASFIKEFSDWMADVSRLDLDIGDVEGNPGKTPLFVGFRPEGAESFCNTILESPSGTAFFELPKQQHPIIQILTRADDYHTARDEAQRIWKYLHGLSGIDLNSLWWIFGIEGNGVPGSIGDDGDGRSEFSANYTVKYEDLS